VFVNVLLGAFNLVPAYPLDGGRVLRSGLWWLAGFDRATTIAVRLGQGFGVLLVAFGLWRFVVGDVGGLWTGLVGWFLIQAAGASLRERGLRTSLDGVMVGQLMDPSPPTVDARSSVADAVYEHMLRGRHAFVVVVDDHGMRGLVRPRDVKRVPRDAWATTRVCEIAQQPSATVTPHTGACHVLDQIDDVTEIVPVVADGHVVGVVRPYELMRHAQLQRELHIETTRNIPRGK